MLETLFCKRALEPVVFTAFSPKSLKISDGKMGGTSLKCLIVFFFFNNLVSALVVLQSGSVRMERGNYCQTAPSKSLSVSGRR